MKVTLFHIATTLPLLLATSCASVSPPEASALAAAQSCGTLASALAEELKVETATHVLAGQTSVQMPAGGGRYTPVETTVPAHCVLSGRFEERIGADGQPYAMRIEMRLPDDWNGGLVFQGGGGLNGSVRPALGQIPDGTSAPGALARGYAVVTTDSGHDAAITPGASFVRDQQAMLNFAYQSIGKVVRVAKRVTEQRYNQRPDRTYYWGCSNGGREALIAAQRYPEEFEGIIAMNPAFELSRAALLAHYSTQTYYSLGMPGDPGAVSLSDMQLVGNEVLRQCDALDGRQDGLVFNHADCNFQPRELLCEAGENEGCLSGQKIDVLERAFAGPLDGAGELTVGPWTWDSGVAGPGWLLWQTGLYNAQTGETFDYFPSLTRDALANYFHFPPLDPAALEDLNHARVPEAMRMMANYTDADATQFSSFADRGGKMIVMTGWADPIFSANRLTAWYDRLDSHVSARGGDVRSFGRLFMNPGMNHCGGGPSLDQMDLLTALDDWVQDNRAPERITVTGEFLPGQSRPMCPWPSYAHYSGTGDGSSAGDYTCRMP